MANLVCSITERPDITGSGLLCNCVFIEDLSHCRSKYYTNLFRVVSRLANPKHAPLLFSSQTPAAPTSSGAASPSVGPMTVLPRLRFCISRLSSCCMTMQGI